VRLEQEAPMPVQAKAPSQSLQKKEQLPLELAPYPEQGCWAWAT